MTDPQTKAIWLELFAYVWQLRVMEQGNGWTAQLFDCDVGDRETSILCSNKKQSYPCYGEDSVTCIMIMSTIHSLENQ